MVDQEGRRHLFAVGSDVFREDRNPALGFPPSPGHGPMVSVEKFACAVMDAWQTEHEQVSRVGGGSLSKDAGGVTGFCFVKWIGVWHVCVC